MGDWKVFTAIGFRPSDRTCPGANLGIPAAQQAPIKDAPRRLTPSWRLDIATEKEDLIVYEDLQASLECSKFQ